MCQMRQPLYVGCSRELGALKLLFEPELNCNDHLYVDGALTLMVGRSARCRQSKLPMSV